MPLETDTPDLAVAPAKKRGKQPQAAPWELTCLCGQNLTGERTESPQKVICEHCEREHFVLPISSYPDPKFRRKKRKKRTEPVSVTVRRQLVSGGRVAGGLLTQLFLLLRTQLVRCGLAIKSWLTPLRIAVIALSCTLLGAGAFGLHQHRQQSALSTLRRAVSEGEAALKEEDWIVANIAYAEAVDAVNVLNRHDEFARDIRQKHRELLAISELCTLSLEDIISEASGKRRVSSNWQTTFDSVVKGKWVVLECWLVPRSAETPPEDSEEPPREEWGLAHPLPVEGELVDIRWPAQLLTSTAANAGDAVHVLCAGQIESLEQPTTHAGAWVLRLQPDSAFLWQSPETCPALGFELDSPWMPQDSLRNVLQRQQTSAQEQTP